MKTHSGTRSDIGLIVSRDRNVRDDVLGALHGAGIESLVCPGPCGSDHRCLGDRVGGCPFIDAATFVVLDTPTQGDVYGDGTPTRELLDRYHEAGRSVLALISSYDDARAFTGEGVLVIRKPVDPQEVRDAVRAGRRKQS